MKAMIGLVALLMLGGGAWAEDVLPTEVTVLGDNSITLYKYFFLTAEENTVLGLVATDAAALALFVPEGPGFAAFAVHPDDGFIRDGVPVASAVALSGLADIATARAEALAACEGKPGVAGPCVVVLEVTPVQ